MPEVGGFDWMGWVVIPLLIFVARLADVTLATLRHILVYKGQRKIVPILGAVEVSIWLLAMGQVMQNLTNVACFLGWVLGFSAGTYLGMLIEEKLALGYQLVRVVVQKGQEALIERVRSAGYGVTTVMGSGARGEVTVLLAISRRRRLPDLLAMIQAQEPQPFYTIEDVRTVGAGFPVRPVAGSLAMEGQLKKK